MRRDALRRLRALMGARRMLEDTKSEAALRRRHHQLVQAHLGLRERFRTSAARNKRLAEQIADEKLLRLRAETDLRDIRTTARRDLSMARGMLDIAQRRLKATGDRDGARIVLDLIKQFDEGGDT